MTSSQYETAFGAFANTIYDVNDLSRLVDELNLVERSLFKDEAGTIYDKARDYLSGGVLSIFEQIEKAGLEPEGDQKQLQFLKDLVSFLNNLATIKVTIAFEPTRSFVMRLNNQISASIGKKCVLDIVIDESVIAGAVFEYKGKAVEKTLKSDLYNVLVTMVGKTYKGAS